MHAVVCATIESEPCKNVFSQGSRSIVTNFVTIVTKFSLHEALIWNPKSVKSYASQRTYIELIDNKNQCPFSNSRASIQLKDDKLILSHNWKQPKTEGIQKITEISRVLCLRNLYQSRPTSCKGVEWASFLRNVYQLRVIFSPRLRSTHWHQAFVNRIR